MIAIQRVWLHMRRQGLSNRMGRGAGEHCPDLLAPPDELSAGNHDVSAFIHCIVDFATKRIQSSDGPAAFRWKKKEAVIKTRTALNGFLLTIIVWRHE